MKTTRRKQWGRLRRDWDFRAGIRNFPKRARSEISLSGALNKNLSIEGILEKEYEHLSQFVGDIERVKKNYAEYKKEKRLSGL